jgi:hypothetical protein
MKNSQVAGVCTDMSVLLVRVQYGVNADSNSALTAKNHLLEDKQ